MYNFSQENVKVIEFFLVVILFSVLLQQTSLGYSLM